MNEFTLAALRSLHRQLLEAGEKYHELHFACARPMDLHRPLPKRTAWPGVSSKRLQEKVLGLTPGYWRSVLGLSVKSGIVVIKAVWLDHDAHLWEGVFYNGSTAPPSDDHKTAYNDAPTAFNQLMEGKELFFRLASEAARCLALDDAAVDWPREPNPIHRLLEAMLQQPTVTSHVNGGFATLRVEGNVFDSAARMIGSQNGKPKSGSQAGTMSDSADNSKCPRPVRPNDPTTRDLSIAVEDGLKAGKTVQQINRDFAEKHPQLSKPMMDTAKRGERRYRKAIANWENADN